jgi:NADPH:quinone reductase-like Zn-dependent oxidoreductase
METMRAITLERFESDPTLQGIPTPQIAPNEVLVRVRASSVNPVDNAIAAGMMRGMVEHEFPVVLGRDYAGVVEQAGSDVTRYAEGEEVYGFLPAANPNVHDGTWAELIVVPEDNFVARKPAGVDLAAAGAAPLAAVTALTAVDALGVSEGDTVLVVGANGGVGSFAVQLAVDAGVEVIGVASEPHRDRVLELGAYEVIDRSRDVVEAVHEFVPEGVDVVFDLYGDERLGEAVRDGGRLVSIAAPPSYRERGVVPTYVFVRPDGGLLEELAALADDGRLVVDLAEVLPLEQAARAQELSEGGHVRGKLVLRVA